jgi:hypothetical protein
MVLDQRHPRAEVLDALHSFSPEGAAFIVESIRGEKIPPIVPFLWREMPVTNLHNMSYAESDGEMADLILKYAENDNPAKPAFHIYRFEWKDPSLMFDTFAEVQRRAAPREWVALHPLHWWRLLRESLADSPH